MLFKLRKWYERDKNYALGCIAIGAVPVDAFVGCAINSPQFGPFFFVTGVVLVFIAFFKFT